MYAEIWRVSMKASLRVSFFYVPAFSKGNLYRFYLYNRTNCISKIFWYIDKFDSILN